MSQIADKIKRVRENVQRAAQQCGRDAEDITLIAVTKTVDVDAMEEAIACGVDNVGENRVQELCRKYEILHGQKIRWHLIGHLQTNKVKYVIDKADLIHSVDSVKLLGELERVAAKCNRKINFLLQVNVSGEESKFGLAPQEVDRFLESAVTMRHARLCGLMTVPPVAKEPNDSRKYFEKVRNLFVDIREKNYDNIGMEHLSMGMSGDYTAAILEGATMIRIGTSIFGQRNYTIRG